MVTFVSPDQLRRSATDITGAAMGGNSPVGHSAFAFVQALVRARTATPLSVWCAGAGGLAEPLTMALLASSASVSMDIIATDVDDAATADVMSGVVCARHQRLPRSLWRAHLQATPHGWRPHLSDNVTMRAATGDLRDVPGGAPFDVVICRDVLHHYRANTARELFEALLQAARGALVITAVDAMAVGLRTTIDTFGKGDVVIDAHSGEIIDVDIDAAPMPWRLAALCDVQAPIEQRATRLLALGVTEARLSAAAIVGALGHLKEADALVCELDGNDVDVIAQRDTLRAVLRLHEERPNDAIDLVKRAPDNDWLASYVLGLAHHRQHRMLDAKNAVRRTLQLLDGCGVAPTAAMFLPAFDPERVAARCAKVAHASWHER